MVVPKGAKLQRGPAFGEANLITGGRLADLIAERRAGGASFEVIARFLFAEYGIEVSSQTVGNWSRKGAA